MVRRAYHILSEYMSMKEMMEKMNKPTAQMAPNLIMTLTQLQNLSSFICRANVVERRGQMGMKEAMKKMKEQTAMALSAHPK